MLHLADSDVVPPSADGVRSLEEEGFVVLSGVLDPQEAAALARRVDELFAREGDAAGREFRHLVAPTDRAGTDYLGNLLAKDDAFRACLVAPRVLGVVRHVLGEEVRVHAMNARRPHHGGGEQDLHAHHGLCNTLWLLDDMTVDNGPTRVIVGSHRGAPGPERLIVAHAGAVVVLADAVLHGGTVNRSGAPRRIVTTAFSRPQTPPQYGPF
jgi:hypothetical protein